ncbi:transcription factor HES-1-like [Ptychodera flava]|uniref:transcription factor HES-1-like n=1 Tax=Ptychodera flava TaxID=63121 RepID=UPI00396A869C
MPADKPVTKTSETRKSSKPIMEKRRRARINESLSQLKTLILDAMKKDSSRHSKLEKADILEMTVKYLRNVQRQQMNAALTQDPTVLSKYRAGFNECFGEVQRYLTSFEGISPDCRSRLLGHLANCCQNMSQNYSSQQQVPATSPLAAQAAVTPSQGNALTPAGLSAASSILQISPPAVAMQNPKVEVTTTAPVTAANIARVLPIMPGTLPNGEVAVLLSPQALSGGQFPSHFIPVYAHGTPALSPVSSLGSPNSTTSSLASPVLTSVAATATQSSQSVPVTSPQIGAVAPATMSSIPTTATAVSTNSSSKAVVQPSQSIPTTHLSTQQVRVQSPTADSDSVWRPW